MVGVGDRVFTSNCRWGTIVEVGADGWCAVNEDNARRTHLNGTRMATRDNISGTRDPQVAYRCADERGKCCEHVPQNACRYTR